MYCGNFIFYFLEVMTMQCHLTCITRNIHVKYQSSSTKYLKVSSKVKVSDRFTECQKDGMTE